ncbi:MAG: type II toxin-antitoxin system RelE/ParE family toxin [Cytophaga sp.]|uniref:type II toxin-antitoxin system RelE/ParE family toxin n=1 Tax=Cytophaga sp. TaxID=29535 RepID=UPI003F7F062D
MGQINWTDKSVAHLKAIHDYIAEDSPLYASNFIKALVNAVDKLKTFPMSGRIVPEFAHSPIHLREVIYRGYRIIYRINPNADIEIVTVAHGREEILKNLNTDWLL